MQLRVARLFYLIRRFRRGAKRTRWKTANSFSIIELHESNIHKLCSLFGALGTDARVEERNFEKCQRYGVQDRSGPGIADDPGLLEGQSARAV